MRRQIKDLTNFIFPVECHICHNPLASHEKFICSHCLSHLPRTRYHSYPMNAMEQRLLALTPFKAATGHFFYSKDSDLAQVIQDMKYRGFHSLGKLLGEIAARELCMSRFLDDIDLIIPVPMHFFKKCLRGYNQTDHIAKGISQFTGLPVLNALQMTRYRKTQTSMNRHQRLLNAKNLFRVKKNIDLNYQNVLIVDDVCTTGATIGGAARAIYDKFPHAGLYLFTLGVTF